MYELKVTSGFAAAHRLTMVGAKCENLHGHNWKVEVYLRGERLDDAGVLLDFGVVKGALREVMATLDHRFLNELPMFAGVQPSSERIATYVARELQERLGSTPARVHRVSAWESDNACATYIVEER
jgi:6-pyruvoyltetrahydropterin/6-carboxytetrahydropterin synthase